MSRISRIYADPVPSDGKPVGTDADASPKFAALLKRHRTALLGSDGLPLLLQRLARQPDGGAAQPQSPPTQREPNAAFAHSQTPKETNAPQSGVESSVPSGAQSGGQGVQRPASSAAIGLSRATPDRSQVANRSVRQAGGRPTGSDSSREESHAQAPTPVARRELTADEIHFGRAFGYVLQQASEFCTNKAVQENGRWETQIPLNENILPDCLLHLRLSGSECALRFETGNNTSKALISKYAGTLKDCLTDLMRGKADLEVAISVHSP